MSPRRARKATLPEGELLAAVDIGSNSFHMVVGRSVLGQLRIVDRLKEHVRLAEGLDATETRFCQHQGIITDERQLVNWPERREYILAAAKLTGYYIDGPEKTGALAAACTVSRGL